MGQTPAHLDKEGTDIMCFPAPHWVEKRYLYFCDSSSAHCQGNVSQNKPGTTVLSSIAFFFSFWQFHSSLLHWKIRLRHCMSTRKPCIFFSPPHSFYPPFLLHFWQPELTQLCPILRLINSSHLDVIRTFHSTWFCNQGWNPRHTNLAV